MNTYTLSSTKDELKQILALQKRNLPTSVQENEQKTEGFVTVQHTLEILRAMHKKCPHILAKHGDTVVGYALSMHPDFGDSIEVLKPMFEQIKFHLAEKNFIVMGQICINKTYRKKGIFRNLYLTMKMQVTPPYSAIITEVNAKNTRSLEAHYAVGFKELRRYMAGEQEWVLISLK